VSPPRMDQPFVNGTVQTSNGPVPRVGALLTTADFFGAARVRLGVGRMSYTVDPGLYALGEASSDDPVFVTANYKLSFDSLRKAVPGRKGWILALDTKGVNVWCAAGKGTFGTEELLARISSSNLANVVSHRTLILPQLAGPGVAAFEVKQRSGFRVVYGPVRAEDLPAFLDSGLKATPEMRTKRFPASERLVLVPVELVGALKTGIVVLALMFLASLALSGLSPATAFRYGRNALLALLLGVMAGAFFTPLLLPWLPGRSFSLKGLLPGLAGAALFFIMRAGGGTSAGSLEICSWLFMIPAVSTYLAMNFTGSSTFTSLSGVKKEMRRAVPLQIAGAALGLIFWFTSFFVH